MAFALPLPGDDPSNRPAPDYRIDEFILDPLNRSIPAADIGEMLTDANMTLSIEQQTEITVDVLDVQRRLLRGDFLTGWAWGTNADDRNEKHWILDGRVIRASLDDLDLQLVKVSKSGDTLTLTFTEEAVALLLAHKGARKATRFDTGGGVTRAQFVASLCRAAGVAYYIPEIDKRSEIVKPQQNISATERKSKGSKGLDGSASFKIKRVTAKPDQRKNVQIALDVADSMNAPTLAVEAMLCAGIGESAFRGIPNQGGSNYTGVFQGSKNLFKASDTTREAHYFLRGGKGFNGGGAIHLAKANPHMGAGEIALRVEGSGKSPSFYGIYLPEARAIMRAYKPGFSSSGGRSVSVQVAKPYNFTRGHNESSWDAIIRLAEEVGWRAFVRKGVLWYVSEEYLFNQAPRLSFREGLPGEKHANTGVENVDFDADQNARNGVAEINVTARAERWTALPGMVGTAYGMGAADGRWITATIEKPLWDDTATITCHKPMPTKPEPAPDVNTQQFQIGASGKIGKGSNALHVAYAVYLQAKLISQKSGSYLWGGGHGPPLSHVSVSSRMDCSSSTSLALFRAGAFEGHKVALVSGAFNTWGSAGEGKYMTVWYHGGHVFIEFKIPGLHGKRLDTSQHPGSGPKLCTTSRSHAGFRARHWHG